MTQSRSVSDVATDVLAGIRGAAAQLGTLSATLAEVAAEFPDGTRPELLKLAAQTLQIASQRAMLTVLSIGAGAGRLEAFAFCQGVVHEAHERVRARIEAEAARDAATYLAAVEKEGETQAAGVWAKAAFGAWVDDPSGPTFEPLSRNVAMTTYLHAFLTAVGGSK